MAPDEHKAKGAGITSRLYDTFSKNPVEAVKRIIIIRVTLDKRSRVYMIYLNDEGENEGTFILALTKQPPWTEVMGQLRKKNPSDEP